MAQSAVSPDTTLDLEAMAADVVARAMKAGASDAEAVVRAGRAREALTLYTALLGKVEIYDARRYDAWLEGALAAYEALGRSREAGYVLFGLRRFAEAQRHFPAAERPLEWALAASRLGRHAEAARVLTEAGQSVLAAV